ncbi:MAG: hypothetical protein V4532_04435 [Pseudomonadota bacterium]
MAGYAFNWGDADITDAMTNVKCSGMISEAGGDGYGGTNWCFGVVGGAGQQWHIHFNGGADGRKVNVIRLKASSSDAGGSNMLKYLDTGRGYPAERTNLKGLITSCASDYPQHVKLFTALQQALNTFVAA